LLVHQFGQARVAFTGLKQGELMLTA